MRKRVLGRTGLAVNVLGYGAGQLRGPRHWNGRPVSDEQANRILNAVLDAGINFIDTANIYGPSEELIGRFIGARRDEYFLATKCGCQLIPGIDHDNHRRFWNPEFLMESVNTSLIRLQTDHVDLLQLHNPTVRDVEENDLVRFLNDVRRAGKTRFIGISTTLPDLAAFLAMDVFDVFQIPYSAFESEHEEMIHQVAARGTGTIIRGGVAQGSPGKVGTSNHTLWHHAQLDDLLNGMTQMEFLLRFTLSQPDLHTAIVATLNPEHLWQNVRAAEKGALPDNVYAEAKRRLTIAREKTKV